MFFQQHVARRSVKQLHHVLRGNIPGPTPAPHPLHKLLHNYHRVGDKTEGGTRSTTTNRGRPLGSLLALHMVLCAGYRDGRVVPSCGEQPSKLVPSFPNVLSRTEYQLQSPRVRGF